MVVGKNYLLGNGGEFGMVAKGIVMWTARTRGLHPYVYLHRFFPSDML